MKVKFAAILLALSCLASPLFAADPADSLNKAKAAVPRIKKLAADPVVIAAIKEQNAKKVSLAEIQKIDKVWTDGDNKVSDDVSARPCSKKLQELLKKQPDLIEAFAMDDQGANVCMSDRTSDYWQGDEAKWQKSFNGGKGGVNFDERKFDSSAKAVIIQVSVPVTDQGKVIGALTVGVKAE
jgi:hypothetical protein